MHYSQIRSSNRQSGNFNNSSSSGFSNFKRGSTIHQVGRDKYAATMYEIVEVKYTHKELTLAIYSHKDANDIAKMICRDKNLYIDPTYLWIDNDDEKYLTTKVLNDLVAELMTHAVRRN